jgi:aspartyl-tRNA(Asn)/glutamyl-tRNA(Gln) amidotransferase subunit C
VSISKQDVEHVARLARLALTEEEKERYTAQLGQILGYVEKLSQLNTDNVPPTSHVLPMSNVWREDKVEPSTEQTLGSPADILANAPEREGPLFKVKKVIE